MIKKSAVILLSSCFILGSGFTSLADNSNKSGTLNEVQSAPSVIRGADNKTDGGEVVYSTVDRVGTIVTTANRKKESGEYNWRGEGRCKITPIDGKGPITWDITLEVDLFRNGHVKTSANETTTSTSSAKTVTKYVPGASVGEFTCNVRSSVVDDNGVNVGGQQVSTGK